MAYRKDWISLIRALAGKYGVDPQAALAVASREGLSGGVGDQGTSFGPFQLHVGGALPQGRGQAWAESPAGIEYALRQIGSVAGGMTGRRAIENIVRRFERPANPDAEVSGAVGALGQFGGGGAAPAALPPGVQAASAAPEKPWRAAAALLAQTFGGGQAGPGAYAPVQLAKFVGRSAPPPVPAGMAFIDAHRKATAVDNEPRGALYGKGQSSALAEAFYDPLGSYDNGRFGGAIGGHSDHVHLSITKPQAMLAAIRYAQQHGLRVGENPYVDKVDPVHVKGSYHYRDFAGIYGGRKLGEAIDVSGSGPQMAAYYKWATRNLR